MASIALRVASEMQLKKLESVNVIKSIGLRLENPKGRKTTYKCKRRTRYNGGSYLPNSLISSEYQGRIFIRKLLIKSIDRVRAHLCVMNLRLIDQSTLPKYRTLKLIF